MKVYLAALNGQQDHIDSDPECCPPYVMESMKSIENWEIDYARDGEFELMVDSGAFTYLTNPKQRQKAKAGAIDWEEYAERYAEFVRDAGSAITHFVELDLDGIIPYSQVRKLRSTIERIAGRQCVPAWHPSRGKEEFLSMCDKYDYVSIGGLYDEISEEWFQYLPWFIERAHERDAGIHGLGFTRWREAEKYRFDSIDSTSWLNGSKYAHIFQFNGDTLVQHRSDRRGRSNRLDAEERNRHNLREWARYARYMDGRW